MKNVKTMNEWLTARTLSESVKVVDIDGPEDDQILVAFDNDPNDKDKKEPDTWRVIDTEKFNEWLEKKYNLKIYMEWNGTDEGDDQIINWENVYRDYLNAKYIKLYVDEKIRDIKKLPIY